MAVGRITSEMFHNMGIMTKDGRVITFKQHLTEIFRPEFDKHADEFARIFNAPPVKDKR